MVLTKLLLPLSLSAPPSGARCGSAVQVTHGLQLLGGCLYYLKKIFYSNTLNYIVLKTGHRVFPISKIIICCNPQKPVPASAPQQWYVLSCCGVSIRAPLLLFTKSSPWSQAECFFSSKWPSTICPMPYNNKQNVLSTSLKYFLHANKDFFPRNKKDINKELYFIDFTPIP